MTNSQKAKKHHFVPECYLKNFRVHNTLYTLDVKKVRDGLKENVRKKQPGQVCYEENYYKIEDKFRTGQLTLNNYDDLFVESDLLHRIESKYSKLLYRIITSEIITLEDAVDWADFIIQMKCRNPYWLERTLKKKKDDWVNKSMEDIYKTLATDFRYSHISNEIKKYLADLTAEGYKTDPDINKKLQLETLIYRDLKYPERNEKFRNALVNCNWYLLKVEKPPFFITSDNPGFSLTGADDLTYNTKFTNGFSFHFPLSPNYCLLINDYHLDNSYSLHRSHKNITHGIISPNMVLSINNRTIQIINRLIIASDDWYLSKILELNKPRH